MNTTLPPDIQSIFANRLLNVIRDLMAQHRDDVDAIQSADAPEAVQVLNEASSTLTNVFQMPMHNSRPLFEALCEMLRTFSPYFDLRGMFTEQRDWAQTLLQYFRDHAKGEEDTADLSLLLVIANMFHRLGEHDDALEIFNFVLSIDRHRETHPGFAITCHNMALLYLNRGDPVRGMEACQRALDIDQHNENARGIAVNLLLMADFHEKMEQPVPCRKP